MKRKGAKGAKGAKEEQNHGCHPDTREHRFALFHTEQ
jgi:hypothetical protein